MWCLQCQSQCSVPCGTAVHYMIFLCIDFQSFTGFSEQVRQLVLIALYNVGVCSVGSIDNALVIRARWRNDQPNPFDPRDTTNSWWEGAGLRQDLVLPLRPEKDSTWSVSIPPCRTPVTNDQGQ